MYEILTVPESAPEVVEQLGTKRKFWFSDENGGKCLFKEGRPGTGENWAEKVASELCSLLQIPHAEYHLATWQNTSGVISPTIVSEGGRLVLGNELLQRFISGYEKERRYKQKQHTIKRVLILIRSEAVAVPIDFEPVESIRSALDVFIGYLMLDAWIANQDRHHENWGIIVSSDKKIHLAPTFDHASGFGRNEIDANREDRLTTRDRNRNMDTYVSKAVSPFYLTPASATPLTTVEAFKEAGVLRPRAAIAWLDKLQSITENRVEYIFDELPYGYTSEITVNFAKKILELNKNRLLTLRGAFI